MSRASLDGAGWGQWRGRWKSEIRLEGVAGVWRLIDGDRDLRSWASLREALTSLWFERTVRNHSPWVIGWVSYSTCARLAGDLPTLRDEEGALEGVLLLEPRPGTDDLVLSPGQKADGAELVSSLDDGEFADCVERIRSEIEAGNVYQVNLCRRYSMMPWIGGLQALFDTAKGGAEPDYLSSMSWGGEKAGELVCGSMELLLDRKDMHIETKPIKGTRRRGPSSSEDFELIQDLEKDPKERAELAMIVDLERNDLGRVAIPGSVCVEDPGSVHSWATIHHRVARLTAEIEEGVSPLKLVQAVVPGGSVTGCPKRAAMAAIVELEPVSRGPFTGALGVVAGNGDLRLALPIRTAWTDSMRLEMASGCGIVWESEPWSEVAESRLKLVRWIDLLEGEVG